MQDCPSDAGQLMRRLYKQQLYTDVTFFSGRKTLPAHRAVVAAHSDYFADLLFGDTKAAVGMQMEVEIKHTPFSVFEDIVNYCYTGDLELADFQTVLETYAAVQVFQIEQLIDRCKVYLESADLTEHNVCSVLEVCKRKQIDDFKERCLEYIKNNTSNVIRSADFEKCSFSTVREICDLEGLRVSSEAEVCEAVLGWSKVQPEHSRKELVKSLLKCVRFLSFSPKQFGDFVQKNPGCMSAGDSLKILMYLNNPTAKFFESLPNWCNKRNRTLLIKNVFEDVLDKLPEDGRIQLHLEPTEDDQRISELTSSVLLKCLRGKRTVQGVRFSFEGRKGEPWLAQLTLNVRVFPGPFHFRKCHSMKSEESVCYFTKSVNLQPGKIMHIEVLSRVTGCRFLRFLRWQNDGRDFEVGVSSKPHEGNLNFVSEILYSTP